MKAKKLIVILLSLAACVGVGFALSVILPNANGGGRLDAPSFLRVEGHVLNWTAVKGADFYEVEVNGGIRTAAASSLPLRYADDGARVRVRSVSRTKESSEFSEPFVVRFSREAMTSANIVTYALEERGATRKEFIERGTPVSIEPEDYSPLGYEFQYWYEKTPDGERRIYEREVFWRSVTLYAKATPIDYPITFFGVEGLPFEGDLPDTYNARTLPALLDIVYEEGGYRLAGWYAFEEGGEMLSKESVFIGALTLYPRISRINEGLRFERCDGGWAVKGFSGEESVVHVPAVHLGEPVVKALGEAFKDGEGTNIEKVVFHGDIVLERKAFDGCANLKEVVFKGDVTAKEGAFITAEPMGDGPLSIEIFGVPNPEEGFITGYLSLPTEREVIVCVQAEYAEYLSQRFPEYEIREI